MSVLKLFLKLKRFVKMKDYRSTETDIFPPEKDINLHKAEILEGHRTPNHYSFIHERGSLANKAFRKAFNYKCAYCGVNEVINSVQLFEIDHYICKSSAKLSVDFDNFDNLISSCYACNRRKSGIDIENDYLDILNPKCNIQNVFTRSKDFKIIINSNYNSDKYILYFYRKMKFDHNLRRLDFLILSIIDLESIISNHEIKEKLTVLIEKLKQKRNRMTI